MKESKIIDRYLITYYNGIIQEKDLISGNDYENIIKPIQDEIHDFECDKDYVEVKKLKANLKILFGNNYFTDESPIYKAIETGILCLPYNQGGCSLCTVIKKD